jgi:hypothetical protein
MLLESANQFYFYRGNCIRGLVLESNVKKYLFLRLCKIGSLFQYETSNNPYSI